VLFRSSSSELAFKTDDAITPAQVASDLDKVIVSVDPSTGESVPAEDTAIEVIKENDDAVERDYSKELFTDATIPSAGTSADNLTTGMTFMAEDFALLLSVKPAFDDTPAAAGRVEMPLSENDEFSSGQIGSGVQLIDRTENLTSTDLLENVSELLTPAQKETDVGEIVVSIDPFTGETVVYRLNSQIKQDTNDNQLNEQWLKLSKKVAPVTCVDLEHVDTSPPDTRFEEKPLSVKEIVETRDVVATCEEILQVSLEEDSLSNERLAYGYEHIKETLKAEEGHDERYHLLSRRATVEVGSDDVYLGARETWQEKIIADVDVATLVQSEDTLSVFTSQETKLVESAELVYTDSIYLQHEKHTARTVLPKQFTLEAYDDELYVPKMGMEMVIQDPVDDSQAITAPATVSSVVEKTVNVEAGVLEVYSSSRDESADAVVDDQLDLTEEKVICATSEFIESVQLTKDDHEVTEVEYQQVCVDHTAVVETEQASIDIVECKFEESTVCEEIGSSSISESTRVDQHLSEFIQDALTNIFDEVTGLPEDLFVEAACDEATPKAVVEDFPEPSLEENSLQSTRIEKAEEVVIGVEMSSRAMLKENTMETSYNEFRLDVQEVQYDLELTAEGTKSTDRSAKLGNSALCYSPQVNINIASADEAYADTVLLQAAPSETQLAVVSLVCKKMEEVVSLKPQVSDNNDEHTMVIQV